ncbi:Peptidyl-prolyl cis-trans isomerase FKBP62 [Camellia lanceoleosa]|uniref:Peptidyl-prolyl cis-trans isomerase FKBP62 n=1 Tax=Camellia lanceoleosa TaxID=1840588 RepID=A0ACC0FKJ4_9ERIC|nr:Peptidyl-prolyl cis-trans isomerase FKBP62 [Camellia lanceoleosa]
MRRDEDLVVATQCLAINEDVATEEGKDDAMEICKRTKRMSIEIGPMIMESAFGGWPSNYASPLAAKFSPYSPTGYGRQGRLTFVQCLHGSFVIDPLTDGFGEKGKPASVVGNIFLCAFAVKLIGKLEDGTIFLKKGHDNDEELFEFKTDEEQVIEGLDIAVMTMKKGEIALLTVAPKYAFGSSESHQELAVVPPNSYVMYSAGGCCRWMLLSL